MDVRSDTNFGESSQSSILGYVYDSLAPSNNSSRNGFTTTCALCQRSLSSDIFENVEVESINLCSDCKFMILEDHEITSPDPRRMVLSSTIRRGSSESIESEFSRNFSQMVNLARQSQSLVLDDNQSVDDDGAARLVQHSTSSRTTPSGSRRWRRVFSDTESDGETESNISFRRTRLFHGDSDMVSYSAYGGDSDASVDGQSLLGNDILGHPGGGSDLESDTDIDPMNAGQYQWNLEDADESEWEEADVEGNTVESSRSERNLHGPLISNRNDFFTNWHRRLLSPEIDGTFTLSTERNPDINFEELGAQSNIGDLGDYFDTRDFTALLERLAETENSRRGSPPASETFIKNMPCVNIREDHDKVDNLACAICKDSLTVGTDVNQLPCLHLYHPNCILPWLNQRNTCPICRFELPTDDKDYEESKRSRNNGLETRQIHQLNEDNSAYNVETDEPSRVHHGREQREVVDADIVGETGASENQRNRWFFFAAAAAPIVSVIGFSLMLWFGKPSENRRLPSDHIPYSREGSRRRWWSFV